MLHKCIPELDQTEPHKDVLIVKNNEVHRSLLNAFVFIFSFRFFHIVCQYNLKLTIIAD